jgi:hypothetical protein
MALTRFTQAIDDRGYPIISCRPQSNYINAKDFSGAGAKTDTPPAGANIVVIGCTQNVDVFVTIGGAAAVPRADVTHGTASMANPLAYQLNGATTVGVAVAAACSVTLEYYQ